jgi:hypothetical protein
VRGLNGLRGLGAKIFEKLVRIPMIHAVEQQRGPSMMSGFSSSMFGRQVGGGGEAARLMRQMAQTDPVAYAAKLATSLQQNAVEPIIQAHIEKYGDDPSQWPQEALRATYTSSGDGTGHAVLVVTIERHPDPVGFVSDPTSFRSLTDGFPGIGVGAGLKEYLKIANAQRGFDGALPALSEMWPTIVAEEVKRRKAGEAPSGRVLLGPNCIVGIERLVMHVAKTFKMLSSLMVTSGIHSQDGLVPWSMFAHDRLRKAVVCVSVHLGDHPIAGGNAVNAAIAVHLFKLVFRRGIMLHALRGEMVDRFGAERAIASVLDPEIREWFEDRVKQADPAMSWDAMWLIAADAGLGELMNDLRLIHGGNDIATLDADAFTAQGTAADLDRIVDEGVDRTKADGYTGPPMVEVSDPAAVLMPPSRTMTGANTIPPDAPQALIEDVTEPAAALENAMAEMPMDAVRAQVDGAIASASSKALDAIGDTSGTSPDKLAQQVDDKDLRANVRAKLLNAVLAALSAMAVFATVAKALGGEEEAEELSDLVVGDKLWKQVADESTGASYLRSAVTVKAAERIAHDAAEHADQMQVRAADAARRAKDADSDRSAQQAALEAVKQEISREPQNPDLQQQQKQLEQRLAETEQTAREAEAAQSDAERRERDARDTARRSVEDAARAKDTHDAAADRVFGQEKAA